MISARLSRFPDQDEIGNLKFTSDEEYKGFLIWKLLFFWFFSLRQFFDFPLEKKEWIWIIVTNLEFKKWLIFLFKGKRFLFCFKLLFELLLWIIWKFYQNLKIENLEEVLLLLLLYLNDLI